MKKLLLTVGALAAVIGMRAYGAGIEKEVVVTPGTAERQADGSWLCHIAPGTGWAWIEMRGFEPCADATGITYDFYAPDFSMLTGIMTFLADPDGGSTRWKSGQTPEEEGTWSHRVMMRDDPTALAFKPDNSFYCENHVNWAKADRFRLMLIRQSGRGGDVRVANLRFLRKATCRPPKAGERRVAWCRTRGLSDRGDWEETGRFLERNKFTDLMALLSLGGCAHYDSKVLERSTLLEPGRDSLKEALSACHRHGARLHVWRVNWDAEFPGDSEAWLAKTRAEGRFQVDSTGAPRKWLCPSDPRNHALEVEAMKELAAKGVDGIHFDYMRFEDRDVCFCPRCLARLAGKTGRASLTAAEVKADKGLFAMWRKLRMEDITSVVREVSDYVRAHHPSVEISAAVQRTPDLGVEALGQDWPGWARAGYLDFVCPMNYYTSVDIYRHVVEQQMKYVKGTKTKLFPAIGVTCSNYPKMPPETFIREVDCVRAHGLEGFSVFVLVPYAEELLPRMNGVIW